MYSFFEGKFAESHNTEVPMLSSGAMHISKLAVVTGKQRNARYIFLKEIWNGGMLGDHEIIVHGVIQL